MQTNNKSYIIIRNVFDVHRKRRSAKVLRESLRVYESVIAA